MVASWISRELPPAQDMCAIALLRLSDEALSEEEWLDEISAYRSASRANSGGLVSIEDGEGYIQGLFFYKIKAETDCGRALEISRVVLPDTLAPGISRNFVAIMEGIARQAECDAIHVALRKESQFRTEAMRHMLEREFSYMAPHWCRRLSDPPVRSA